MVREFWWYLFLIVAGMYLGWIAHGWRDAELTLAASQTAEQTRQIVEEAGSKSAEALEKRLKELKANEIHTEQVIRTETIKPVFSHVCASDEYVRLFNESADQAERALSGKSVNPLSGQPAPSGG